IITGTMYLTAMRQASMATQKQSAGVAAASTGIGASELRPKSACNRSACSVLVGRPVVGPPRWMSQMTSGISTATARPNASVFRAITEQADLLQALFGRNSEAPIPVLAAATPADCFWVAIEACRIAVKYMVPVIILSDGYLANGAEPWRIPELKDIPDFPVKFASDPVSFLPYKRDPHTLARPWAVPGTPGLEHRIGGLEKQDPTGNINYEPLNHENMVRVRAAKVAAVARAIPNVLPAGDLEGDLLIVAWGSTCGSITAALKAQRAKGRKIGHLHLRYLNPLPSNLGDIF